MITTTVLNISKSITIIPKSIYKIPQEIKSKTGAWFERATRRLLAYPPTNWVTLKVIKYSTKKTLSIKSNFHCLFRKYNGVVPFLLNYWLILSNENKCLFSTSILKVGVAVRDDGRKLQKDYGISVQGCVDLRYVFSRTRGIYHV